MHNYRDVLCIYVHDTENTLKHAVYFLKQMLI